MIIKDVIPGFELFQPTSIADAVALLDKYQHDAWRMAGGNDSIAWFKDRIKRPKVVVELTRIKELKGVRETADYIEIGPLTTLTEIENDPIIRKQFGLLSTAASLVASPQIRNSGTIGGNVSQDARCWYYRSGLPCYRAGGNTCFSDTPEGMNREHALFGASRCVAVSPSDLAPVMVALDAQMVVRNAKGERVMSTDDFFIGPAIEITRMTAMEANDLLVAIRLPKAWAGAKFYFEKVTDRKSWDFPLVNVAAAIVAKDGKVDRSRIAVGGVEARPRRMDVAEDTIQGQAITADLAQEAGSAVSRRARPLNYNHFKIPLMESLVMRAVRDAA